MDDATPIEPEYTAAQREELARVNDILAELRTLRDRGLLAEDAFATVESEKGQVRAGIERAGRAAGLIKAARAAMGADSPRAVRLADEARGLAPESRDAWAVATTARKVVGDLDGSIAVCREAVERHGHATLSDRLESLEKERQTLQDGRALTAARLALGRDDPEAALAEARAVLARRPDHTESLELSIDSLIRLGRAGDAFAACEALRPLQPLRAAARRLAIEAIGREAARPPDAGIDWIDERSPAPRRQEPPRAEATPEPPPRWRWSTIAGEFLEDHWQKLILSLAVLLIVVSSTVGAAIVLGDRLWRGEEKCLLATAYTLMFAGFGRGLSKWGAERAGRIMRLTTLIVLPLNFALVGELPHIGRSTPLSMTVFAVDVAAMMALAWVVCRGLRISGGWGTPAAISVMGLLNAAHARSVDFGHGFAALLLASAVFAAAGAWLGHWLARRVADAGDGDEGDAPYFAFGLLTFAFLCILVRIGGTILLLPPTLYALPAMLAAAAALAVARGLEVAGHGGRSRELLKLSGFVLAALGFALGLTRPPERLVIYSASTLAAAFVGLGLFLRALIRERRPVFLYATFAASFLACFAVRPFLGDRLAPMENTIGHLLGYRHRLPSPFRATIGLAVNAAFAALAVFFAKVWGDRRLSRHCQWLGLPVSLAACVLSAFEPLAAVVTMGGYVAAYAIGARLFASPKLVYLACASLAGAAIEGSTFLGGGDVASGAQAMVLAVVGLCLLAACRAMAGARAEYREPVVHSSRAVALGALALGAYAAWPWWFEASWPTAAAAWVLAVLYLAIGRETPRVSIALAACSCGAAAVLLSVRVVSIGLGVPAGWNSMATWAAAVGLVYSVVGARLRAIGPERTSTYPNPLLGLSLGLAWLGCSLVGYAAYDAAAVPGAADLASIAAMLGLVAAGLVVTSAWSWKDEIPASFAAVAASGAAIAGALALGARWGWPASSRTLALACGAWSLVLVAVSDRLAGRTSGWLASYRRPLLALVFGTVAVSLAAAGTNWHESRGFATVLAMAALALGIATRQARERPLPQLALGCGLGAWLCGWGVLNDLTFAAMPAVGLSIGVYLLVLLAAGEAWGHVDRRRGGTSRGPLRRLWLEAAIPESIAPLAWTALLLGGCGLRRSIDEDYRTLTALLAVAAMAFAWRGRFLVPSGGTVVSLMLAWLAALCGTRWALGDGRSPGDLTAWLALTTAMLGLTLGDVRGFLLRRRPRSTLPASLRLAADVLAPAGFVLAMTACGLGAGSNWLSIAAVLLTARLLLDTAAIDREPWRVYAAIALAVVTAYLTLFEIGRGRTPYVPALGVLATLLAIAAWAGERACLRRLAGDARSFFATPLRHAAIVLAFLAMPAEWGAAGPLLFASVPLLLLIKSVPSELWLYAILLVDGAAAYGRFADRLGFEGQAVWAIAAAFAMWGLGLALQRGGPMACARLRLPALRLERPPFELVMLGASAAIGLRIAGVLGLGQPWWAGVWLPSALAVLSLLMLRPYPMRGWVDGFVALACFAIVSAAAPALSLANGWLVLILVLALLWRAVQWVVAPVQAGVCRRLGIGFDGLSNVADEWSIGLIGVASLGLAAILLPILGAVPLGPSGAWVAQTSASWWTGLAAVLLLWANLDLAARTHARIGPRVLAFAMITLLVWWLAVPGSPLLGWIGVPATTALPMATMVIAVLAASLAARRMSLGLSIYGLALGAAAIVLGGLRIGTTTTATFFLAVLLPALASPLRGARTTWLAAGLWASAWFLLAAQVSDEARWTFLACVAVGQGIASAGLMAVASSRTSRRLGLARSIEEGAVVAAGLAALAVAFGLLWRVDLGTTESIAFASTLVAVGVICSILASRWDAWPLAAATQVAILGAYAACRAGFAVPAAADSMVVLILAGLDLGIAEITGRFRQTIHAWPALAAGLILPMASVALALRHGWLSDEALFVLLAAGAFYAMAGGRLGRKSITYPAAVLLNIALWAIWARSGWRLARDPQFFLVPVGLSAIVFAEANRRELGRSNVDSIRGLSLILIYFSLAVPVWQSSSLAAWLGLLVASLAAIFAGIGLRSRSFVTLGLAGFLLDVLYQVGRIGMEHALAKWAIMLAVGIGLVFFVALNEKKRLVTTLRGYLAEVRHWD